MNRTSRQMCSQPPFNLNKVNSLMKNTLQGLAKQTMRRQRRQGQICMLRRVFNETKANNRSSKSESVDLKWPFHMGFMKRGFCQTGLHPFNLFYLRVCEFLCQRQCSDANPLHCVSTIGSTALTYIMMCFYRSTQSVSLRCWKEFMDQPIISHGTH